VALPPEVALAEAEHRYLHRVLQNLAGNAARYARSEVRLSAGIYDNCAYIAVEDDGAGIPKKTVSEFFNRLLV
jgi:two-component system sensor histidine kinase RstB